MAVLSIVIPTYNRKALLLDTLSVFESQIKRNSDVVELLISNNASTDGTGEALDQLHQNSPFFRYVNCTNHVEVGESITRANDMAAGEYVLMWGDDDWPFPFFVDYILGCINRNPNVDLIHYNRLAGRDNNGGLKDLYVQQNTINRGLESTISVKECINAHVLDMTFLTTNVFRRKMWTQNKNIDCTKHYGYEFMGHMLHGMNNSTALYIDFPLCIQRKPATRSWMSKSPKYRFIGIPNMYEDFEKWGLIDDAKSLWMRQGNRNKEFFLLISQASLYKKENRPIFKELISHQYSLWRKIVAFFFVFLCPSGLYKIMRNLIYKN